MCWVIVLDNYSQLRTRDYIISKRTYRGTYLFFLFSKNESSNETNLKKKSARCWSLRSGAPLLHAPTFRLKNTKLKLVVTLLSVLRNFHRVARSRCWFLQFMVKFLDFEAAWTLP